MASSTDPRGSLPRTLSRIAVIIPAHNEDRLIEACLRAVHRASEALIESMEQPPAVTTVVVLDDCSDRTALIVTGHPQVTSITIRARCVGAARHAGVEAALTDIPDPDGVWLANTDADSTVPRQWLTTMARHALAGSDLVLGTVQPSPGLHPAAFRRWARRYTPMEGHRHVHGANFGISGSAYRRLGGWPRLATGEDVAMTRWAETTGLAITRTAAAPVSTSPRLGGRAPDGFATYLARLAEPAAAGGK